MGIEIYYRCRNLKVLRRGWGIKKDDGSEVYGIKVFKITVCENTV
jgi:hypothetical protein